jgi:hypothetical protein
MVKKYTKITLIVLSVLTIFSFYGCASGGKGKGKLELTKEDLDKQIEVPKEVQESFEVKGLDKSKTTEKEAPKAANLVDSAKKDTKSKGKEVPSTEVKKDEKKKPKKISKDESAKSKVDSEKGPFSLNIKKDMKVPFSTGDKVTFDMSYFGVKAGTLTFEVLDNKMINDREVFHFKGSVKSAKMFDLFYKVDDYMQSFIDAEGFYPLKNEMHLDESRQVKKTLEIFDHKKRTSYFKSWRKHVKKGIKEVKRQTEFPQEAVDTLSSLYYLRMFPLKVGDKLKFPVVSDGRVFDATAEVLRKEKVTVEAGTFNTVVLKPETRFEGKLKKMGDIFFWFTDDERHQLVKIKAKIKIGALYAEATEISP